MYVCDVKVGLLCRIVVIISILLITSIRLKSFAFIFADNNHDFIRMFTTHKFLACRLPTTTWHNGLNDIITS